MKNDPENKGPLDPVQLLRAEFTARCQKNPRYSLRAFAKSLGISHPVMSLVLSGKRPLSRKATMIISDRLGLAPDIAARLIEARNTKVPSRRYAESYEKMDLQTFDLISDWVHYAILSLIETPDFQEDPKWIAQRLAINETHAKLCFERLLSLEMIAHIDGKFKQTRKPIKIENGITTGTTRKFHRQLLEKALSSLENDPIEIRDFSSMTLAVDPKLMPYAKERIRQFRRELTAELETKGDPLEVYNLTVQIYPVTKKEARL